MYLFAYEYRYSIASSIAMVINSSGSKLEAREGALLIEDVKEGVLDSQKGCLVEKLNFSRP